MLMSHHDMMKLTIEKHDRERKFAPENGQLLKFKVGDKVTFVNDFGFIRTGKTVTRIMRREEDESFYCMGRRYYIDSDCPWMPVKESNLRLEEI